MLRRFSSLTRQFAVLIGTLALCGSALADNDWIEVRSPNFSVITDAGEKRGREVALRFEQMRYVFGTLIGKDKVSVPVPLQILAFRNTKGFRQFMPLWKGKPITAAGLYQGGEDRNFILLDLSTYDPYSVVFHEYAHLLLNGNFPPTQPWFDEGFAEYYRSIKISGNEMVLGGTPEGTADSLRENRFFRVADLFSVAHNSSLYNESGDHRSMFYAQSWLVVHYLFDKNKLHAASAYFDLVKNRHVAVPQAIEQAFGVTPQQFDSDIQKYYRGNSVRGLKDKIPSFETALYNSQKLKVPDVQAVFADVHLHSPDYLDKALAEYEAILNSDPNHAASHRGLGYAYLQKGDLANAAQHFSRAAALDSNDARVHYYTAMLMNREGGGKIDRPGDMLIHLQRAIQIDPTLADAYHLLAIVQVTNGSPAEALQSINAALRLSPRNDYYTATLAQVFMAQRKWDEATEVFKRLESSDNPQLAANARANLQLVADYRENVHRVEWADLRERNTQKKEWGSKPSAERVKEEAATSTVQESEPAPPARDSRAVKFVKGRLVNVACLADTKAILTITSGAENPRVASLGGKGAARTPASPPPGKTLKLLVPDLKKVVVVGADEFSCTWNNQRVGVNYWAGGERDGEVMSVELQ